MEIVSLGHSSFKFRGKQATVVTDPYKDKDMKVKFPKHVEANIVTVSHSHYDHSAIELVGGAPFVVAGPGEYEIKGVSIIGVDSFHDTEEGRDRGHNTMYRIEIDGIKIIHLGDLGHMLSSTQIDALDGVEVLCIPVGGVYTIDAQIASQLVADLDPRIVIPMHDNRSNDTLAPLDAFLKIMNKGESVPVPKLTVSRDTLPAEMHIVVLA